jgi:hypothetical protein
MKSMKAMKEASTTNFVLINLSLQIDFFMLFMSFMVKMIFAVVLTFNSFVFFVVKIE